MYHEIKEQHQNVEWMKIMYDNPMRPRALFTLWMDCHDRLATKERLSHFDHFCSVSSRNIDPKIIDNVIYRCWLKPKFRKQLSYIMIP